MGQLIHSAFTFAAGAPRYATKLAFDLAWHSARAVERLTPDDGVRAAWQELRNKLEAFGLFECVEGRFPSGSAGTLAAMVEQAALLGPFRSVWAIEGVGHRYTERTWARSDRPRRLLRSGGAEDLPERSLIPLHSGMGLSLANRCLAAVRPGSGAGEMAQALSRFRGLCEDNSREGYLGAAYEALGLVARNVYPDLIERIDECLAAAPPELRDYLWHGAGRALYFGPRSLLPASASAARAVQAAQRDAPDARAERNLLAGLAWAMTLVNIRAPQVLEATLRLLLRESLDDAAFANGVRSALTVWRAAAPADPHLQALGVYGPGSSDPDMRDRWMRLIADPYAQAAARYTEVSTHGRFGELFRYSAAGGAVA